jgi:hypothetical protein
MTVCIFFLTLTQLHAKLSRSESCSKEIYPGSEQNSEELSMDQNACRAQPIRQLLKPAIVVTVPRKDTAVNKIDCERDLLQMKIEEYYLLSASNNLTSAAI